MELNQSKGSHAPGRAPSPLQPKTMSHQWNRGVDLVVHRRTRKLILTVGEPLTNSIVHTSGWSSWLVPNILVTTPTTTPTPEILCDGDFIFYTDHFGLYSATVGVQGKKERTKYGANGHVYKYWGSLSLWVLGLNDVEDPWLFPRENKGPSIDPIGGQRSIWGYKELFLKGLGLAPSQWKAGLSLWDCDE